MIAEAAVRLELVEAGLRVLEPVGGQAPYDLVVHAPDARFITVQVKHGRLRDGCVVSNTCTTDHGQGRRPYTGRADVLCIYASQLRTTYVLPVEDAPRYTVRLRLEPPRNRQVTGVRIAAEHELARWAEALRGRALA